MIIIYPKICLLVHKFECEDQYSNDLKFMQACLGDEGYTRDQAQSTHYSLGT